MSAYVLLAAQLLAAMQQAKIDQKRRTPRSSSTSHALSTSSLGRKSTRSSHRSGSLDKNPAKKVYDFNLNSYVDRQSLRTPVERRLDEHDRVYEQLHSARFRDRNAHMSQYLAGGRALFTPSSVQMLRYSYFQDFVGDTAFVATQMLNRTTDGRSALRFGRKLDKIRAQQDRVVRNKRSGVYGSMADDFDTSDDDDCEPTPRSHSRQLSHMGGANVRALVKSHHFWNDVYQDLKFHSIQNKASVNYFDLLPSINQTTTFFGDVLDHFLYHLQAHVMPGDDGPYFYFRDTSCEYLQEQAHTHHAIYNTQAQVSHSMSTATPLARDLAPHQLLVHRDMMGQLVETVVENLRHNFSFSGQRTDHKQTEALLGTWRYFLRFLVFEVLLAERPSEQASGSEYPEPNVDSTPRGSSDRHIFRSSMELVDPHIRHASPASAKARRGSMSSRNTSISAISEATGGSLSSHMSAVSSPSTMSSPALRFRDGVVSSAASGSSSLVMAEHVNFPYQAGTPKVFFEDRKEKKKKKLIFDKFKKTRDD